MTDDGQLLARAASLESDSHDPRTAVGCVIRHPTRGVLATAANRLPPGLTPDRERLEAPAKYLWIEHAERAALLIAARDGIATDGACIYVHGGFPCADCARAIVAAGLRRVVYSTGRSEVGHWQDSYRASEAMFAEAGIEVVELADSV